MFYFKYSAFSSPQVTGHCSRGFPRHLPRYYTSFEAFNNQVGNHFVDIKSFHYNLLMPLRFIMASGTPIKSPI